MNDGTSSATNASFDDCAVDYANYWFGTESTLVRGLSDPDQRIRLTALQKAAHYFRVARTMPRAFDVNLGLQRLAPALAVLEVQPLKRLTADRLGRTVYSFRRELGDAYGGKDLLSPATKFLWLKRQDVVIIFDSYARKALGTPDGDYESYVQRWQTSFAYHRDAIALSCRKMAVSRLSLTLHDLVSEARLSGVVEQDWFRRRVHDIYLWKRGAPERKPTYP